MRIKTKLSLGVGLLFSLITVLLVVSVIFINKLSNDTQNILVANYNTIDYVRHMLMAIDEDMTSDQSILKFKNNLELQQKNVTEPGEQELTDELNKDFNQLLENPYDSLIEKIIRKDLTDIMFLNMQAIQRKSAIATNTASSANTVLAITGTLCFVVAFTLLLNLPGNIANPIKELTNSIKEIAAKNYSQRVHFEEHNEFGDLANSFNVMAKKLEEYNNSNIAKLMIEKKRIETLINNMHDPIIGLDENKRVIFINEEALKIAGLKLEETLGKKAQDIAVHNDLVRALIQQMTTNTSFSKNGNKPLKIFADGKESYFDKEIIKIEITPTGETSSREIGDVILLKNITPFKEIDVAKTNFIATVSHELKTPISSMMMSLQLLENEKTGGINDNQKQLIASLKEDGARLLKITGELLNMSQVETGNIQLAIQQSDPVKILNYALDAVKTEAEHKHITIKAEVEADLPLIKADEEKTSWVLINLLTNAIHYSPEQSQINVSITRQKFDLQLPGIKFSVKDRGKGIDSKYKDKIFDRYFQVPGSIKSGSGLGLAISKEFIEAQGGKIQLESELGTGSQFSVFLNAV